MKWNLEKVENRKSEEVYNLIGYVHRLLTTRTIAPTVKLNEINVIFAIEHQWIRQNVYTVDTTENNVNFLDIYDFLIWKILNYQKNQKNTTWIVEEQAMEFHEGY